MTADNEICRMDALTLAARIRGKELSAIEVTEAVLRRMAALEAAYPRVLHADA